MVTITKGKQVWKISKDEYEQDKAKWLSRGTVEFSDKDPMLSKKEQSKIIEEIIEADDKDGLYKPEYDLQTEVEIKTKIGA